ncbi:unnamed protein product [Adineta steineri]|uniref:Transcription initiation factor IIE subunit alpha N-terminal domain-containing protein n=1 Tax=Adineta steineri TaxID=433720 RepID=A0A814UXE1_9BILA|nr:unnamed protein product [Adineta steineri]CAF3805874.1 unnamed protein product [Adineta steineri]
MSSIASGGGLFLNMDSSIPQPTNLSSTNVTTSSSNDIPLPIHDTNDPRAILKALIRFRMRTFYDVPKSLIIEYIYYYERIKQQDLADLLYHRLEFNDGTTDRRTQDQYYYKIHTTAFINVVRYRLIHMQMHVENLERQQIYKQSNYKCEQCAKEYTELDIEELYDLTQDTLICLICGDVVHEDVDTKDTTNRQTVNIRFFQQNGSNSFDRTTAISHEIQIVIEKDG